MLTLRRHEKDFILRGDPKYVEKHAAEITNFAKLLGADAGLSSADKATLATTIASYDNDFKGYSAGALKAVGLETELQALCTGMAPLVDELQDYAVSLRKAAIAKGVEVRNSTFLTALVVVAGLSVLVGAISWLLGRSLSKPLIGMKQYMQNLTNGDYSREVPYAERGDEIGEMARSVAHFRQTAIERNASREQVERARGEKEQMDAATAAGRARDEAERAHVIENLTIGLERLSAGDLTYRIRDAFAPEYEKLRTEFNSSIHALGATLGEISAG
ncbi:HAMP domain-containing protein [Hoeflea marina]|uniref:histidine kinase n=2 Tax=Hoeflea marina TaxID=274592 RepID=A0A317PL21_9HYPH|nr:HAMP domain-containing protein [Hoeflea marina]